MVSTKFKCVSMCVASCLLFAGVAFAALPNTAQCFTEDQLITLNKENVAGGTGTLYGQFAFTRTQATADQAIKEIGWMTLKPGASIGLHKHGVNEDTYIIVSGHGIFTDSKGVQTKVKAGDITIARPNQAHALRNDGKEPLKFLDIIAENDGPNTTAANTVKK